MLGTNAEHFFSPFKKNPPKIPPSEPAQAKAMSLGGSVVARTIYSHTQIDAASLTPPYLVKQFNIPRAIIVPNIGKGLNLKDLKKLRMKGMSATHL